MSIYEFDAEIIKHDGINGAYIIFPYDVEKEFGTKGQVKVSVTFDGAPYRGSLVKMGQPCHIIGLTQEIRKSISKNSGDQVHVVLQKDDQPRIVVVPEDFKLLLDKNPEAGSEFERLSYTHKKEYVEWIQSAKKPETRENRINNTIEKLIKKVK